MQYTAVARHVTLCWTFLVQLHSSSVPPPSTHHTTPLYLLAMKSSFSRALTSLQYIQNWVLVYCWLQVLLLSVHIQTDTISTRAVLLMQNKGITDTLMASSVPLVGRVEADTLRAWSAALDFEIQLDLDLLRDLRKRANPGAQSPSKPVTASHIM